MFRPPWSSWRNVDGSDVRHPAPSHQLFSVGGEDGTVVPEPEAPPDGGYGWICLGAMFTINCFTWGVIAVS